LAPTGLHGSLVLFNDIDALDHHTALAGIHTLNDPSSAPLIACDDFNGVTSLDS
jgi:hypothetical protein